MSKKGKSIIVWVLVNRAIYYGLDSSRPELFTDAQKEAASRLWQLALEEDEIEANKILSERPGGVFFRRSKATSRE